MPAFAASWGIEIPFFETQKYNRFLRERQRFHRADGADQLEIRVVSQQVALKVESQWCNAIRRHEKTNLHPHFCEVLVGRGQLILLILDTQYGVLVSGPLVGLAGRGADADDRRLVEALLVSARVGKLPEQLSMHVAKIVWCAECRSIEVVLWKQDTEVVVAHVGGKVVPHDAVDAFVRFFVENAGFQYLNQRKYIIAARGVNTHLDGDNLEFDRVAISRRIVPMRQVVEAIVNHPQRVAQILLPARSPGQVGKIGSYARAVRWLIVFIETNALEVKGKFFVHCDQVT